MYYLIILQKSMITTSIYFITNLEFFLNEDPNTMFHHQLQLQGSNLVEGGRIVSGIGSFDDLNQSGKAVGLPSVC